MDVLTFAKLLLDTEELDPVYCMLHRANLEPKKLHRWLIAFWCFYDSGVAGVLSEEEDDFWVKLYEAVTIQPWYPRGTERRHFRGKHGWESVLSLAGVNTPPGLENCILSPSERIARISLGFPRPAFVDAARAVKTWNGFGSMMVWKVCDMLERLDVIKVQFDKSCYSYLYKSPLEGANLVAGGLQPAIDFFLEQIGDRKAPPLYDRPINIQEIETILCGWSTYTKGTYTVGSDIIKIRKQLLRFARCKTNQLMLTTLPKPLET